MTDGTHEHGATSGMSDDSTEQPSADAATTPAESGHHGGSPQWIAPAAGGLLIAVLFIWYFRTAIGLIFRIAASDPNWSHAFLVPLVSAWFIWRDREQLRATPPRPCWWGLLVLAAGMAAYQAGLFLQSSMAIGWPMVLSLVGLALLLGGTGRTRILLVPILYLLFAVKVTVLWEPVAERLQRVAAALAAGVISLAGMLVGLEADAEGAVLRLFHHGVELSPPLDVDEACSGLRMLMALLALSVAWAFAARRSWLRRLAMIAAALPVAVCVNVLRITLTGFMYPWRPDWTRGLSHDLLGFLMVVPALWLLSLVDRAAEWLEGRLGAPVAAGRGRGREDAAVLRPPDESTPAAVRSPHATTAGAGLRGAQWGAFIAAAVVLAAGIAGAGAAARWAGVVLAKKPAPLRLPLDALPDRLGPYRLAFAQTLSERALEVLGSRRYVSRVYRDTRRAPGESGAGIWVHVVYYTGSAETLWVRHTPEQCYIGQGHKPLGTSDAELSIPAGDRKAPRRIPARLFAFLPRGRTTPAYAVYFFVVNGRFVASRRGIRLQALDFRRRTAWYCKIEMLPGRFSETGTFQLGVDDPTATLSLCSGFLHYLLPALEQCLPEGIGVRPSPGSTDETGRGQGGVFRRWCRRTR